MKPIRHLAAMICFALLSSGWCSSARAQGPSVSVRVFAGGLVNPRGLKFGPDGNLYVADLGYGAIYQFDVSSTTQQYQAAKTLQLPSGFTPGGFANETLWKK